jgi:ectoine hydroxylase-related dioxygenase (phytanoyl-CoA dioxygenase family)
MTITGTDAAVLADLAQDLRDTGPLTIRTETTCVTYRVDGDRITVGPGEDGDTVVALSDAAWHDLQGLLRTFIHLYLAGELVFERGGFAQLADWDPALTYLHGGIPPYRPEGVDLQGLDPRQSFTLDASDEELRTQLQVMGFVHIKAVFTAEEMAAANDEVDRLAGQATPGDEESWFVENAHGEQEVCRLVYASRRSDVLRSLESDPRVQRLGALFGDHLRVAPDRMEGSAVLLKVPGRTKGLSNIPWHQDCGMGGHAVFCPNLSIGIQLTGSTPESGNLLMVPGSHGKTLHYQWQDRLDGVEVVAVDTGPGDVTVHVADVMHASPKPTGGGGRRTMYVTHYPPALWEHIGAGQAYNDLVRNRTAQVASLGT